MGSRLAAALGDVKNLLYQFDTDALPSVFDNVVAYDGGADHVGAYGGVNADNVGSLAEGAIFTRGVGDKRHTGIFIGGSNLDTGESVLRALQTKFFAKFRVSVMLDCNGSNTTASALVASLAHSRALAGKRAVILGGTGPVGQRVAALLSMEGAAVTLVGRKLDVVRQACASIRERFDHEIAALEATTDNARAAAIAGAQVVVATGAAGIILLRENAWQSSTSLEMLADANASPPAGIEGVGSTDRGRTSHGKILYGPLGFGALKLAVHRECIGHLFERNDLVLDCEQIYGIAKALIGRT
jgi:methylenetetrahydrofolate/methylenetetrahydromethanopterin dehydrogenase (NADP+)